MNLQELIIKDEKLDLEMQLLESTTNEKTMIYLHLIFDLNSDEFFERVFYKSTLSEVGFVCSFDIDNIIRGVEVSAFEMNLFKSRMESTLSKIKPIYEGFISYLIDNPANQERYSTGEITLDMTLPEIQSKMKENSKFQDEEMQSGYDKLLDCLNFK